MFQGSHARWGSDLTPRNPRASIKSASQRRGTSHASGAKLPGGDEAWFAEMRQCLPDFSVFVPGHTIASGRLAGASGSYSNIACLSPRGAVRWWELIERSADAALALERRIQAFLQSHVLPLRSKYGLSDAALDKAMAAAGAWGPTGPRLLWPYRSASSDDVVELARAARRDLPELLGIAGTPDGISGEYPSKYRTWN